MPTWMNSPMQLYIGTDAGDKVPFNGLETVTVSDCGESDTSGEFDWEWGDPYHYRLVSETTYVPQSFTATVKLQMTRAQRIALLYGITGKRDVRRLIRRAERIRRKQLKDGYSMPISNEYYAYLQVVSMKGKYN